MADRFIHLDRRAFLQAAGGACLMNAVDPVFCQEAKGSLPLRLGVVVWIQPGQGIDDAIAGVAALGLSACQVGFEQLSPEVAKPLKKALAKYGVEATAFSEHGPGQRVFDFYNGPGSIGVVPRATREARIHNLQLAADIAMECGIPAIHTHCGFIPENPGDPLYRESVTAVKAVALYCKERGRIFLCETGEETPITLLRLIQDVGTENLFVNLDLANLILYGKGNPVDAMDVIGHLVRGIHAKDGLFPTDGRNLGREVPIGEGKVDFPAVFERLRRVNYKGPVTIEREIEGTEQRKEILRAKAFLAELIHKAYR